eukprot:COSAG02_NODE_1056_length_14925_cov_84.064212_9_plen_58_part_00
MLSHVAARRLGSTAQGCALQCKRAFSSLDAIGRVGIVGAGQMGMGTYFTPPSSLFEH